MSVVETYNVHNDNLAITEFRNYLGNEIEKEVTAVMGGEIYELHSERIIREATEPLKKQLADKDHQLADKETENALLRAEIEKLKQLIPPSAQE